MSTPFTPKPDPPGGPFAPSVFVEDYIFPPSGTVVVPPLPRSDGGLIQSVKSAVVEAMRDALQNTSLGLDGDQTVYIGLEYPMELVQYPGIWVQFSIQKLNKAGVGHEITVQDPDTKEWSFIQEWMFAGRVTLAICALTSISRDRLADALIASLAFARGPELLLTRPQADTKQFRSLITALDENPYVGMTLQLDTLLPGGQTVTQGTPWAEDRLTYEDSYSFDMIGQFNLQFRHDGMYSLAEIRPGFRIFDGETQQHYNPAQWLDAVPTGPPGPAPGFASRQTNTGNRDYPVM